MDLKEWLNNRNEIQNVKINMTWANFGPEDTDKLIELQSKNEEPIEFAGIISDDMNEDGTPYNLRYNIIKLKEVDKVIVNNAVIGNINPNEDRTYIAVPTSMITDVGFALDTNDIAFDGPYNNLDDLVVSETINSSINKRINENNIEINAIDKAEIIHSTIHTLSNIPGTIQTWDKVKNEVEETTNEKIDKNIKSRE